MRIFFMGTPQLAVPVLERILESNHNVELVITQPDKPTGRRQALTESPIKLVARTHNIPVLQPQKLSDADFVKAMQKLNADIGVVFAYGKMIPKWLLDLPQHGIVNVHASLLPRWRGAAPIQRAIMAGDTKTGVTIMQMAEGLDTGDILLSRSITIEPNDTSGTLTEKISTVSADLIIEALDRIESGEITKTRQDDAYATYADKIRDNDINIDWSDRAEVLVNQVRGLNPKPGAKADIGGVKVKIWKMEIAEQNIAQSNEVKEQAESAGEAKQEVKGNRINPGKVMGIDKKKGPIITTASQPVVVTEVQPENKKRISGTEFARGYRITIEENDG